MRFAEYVLDDIAKNGMRYSRDIWWEGDHGYINHDRHSTTDGFDMIPTENEYIWFVDGIICKTVTLLRGPKKLIINLTRSENKKFLEFHKKFLLEQKELRRVKKMKKQDELLAAQEI